MKSRASFRSHPLHPILIAFPIAFLTGTLVFHLAGILLEKYELNQVAYYLNVAGIVMGVVAAVPGIVDFIYTVPPKSSGKKRAATHGITNVTMLLIFTVACYFRQEPDFSQWAIVAMEVAGVTLMSVAGWMGGTLVYRNQIGVDQRYANAGKWKEADFDIDTGTIEVAAADELEVNAMKLLRLKEKRIVLARSEERYVAFDDHCPHRGGSLAGGSMMCGTVQCPWHGSQFDVFNGSLKAGPSKEGIPTYEVAEKEGRVYITV